MESRFSEKLETTALTPLVTRNRISVHVPANHGAPAVVQWPRQADRQVRPLVQILSND